MPDFWPVIMEARRWLTDARTGAIHIRLGGGRPKLLSRQEDLSLGDPVRLPEGMVAFCPGCAGETELRDYDNKVYCRACDRTMTIWEVKTNQFYRPVGRRAPHGQKPSHSARA